MTKRATSREFDPVADPLNGVRLQLRGKGGNARMPRSSRQLTVREYEVLQLLARGHTNREIAIMLGISVGTVKAYVQHIFLKLGVADRTQAAVQAVVRGLVT